MTIVAAGDATHDALAASVEAAFGDWPAPSNGMPDVDPALWPLPAPPAERLAIVHRPDAAQSELRIGHVGVPRRSPDYHALLVLNIILGGQFVSRINMNLREDKGYTYGARTSLFIALEPPFLAIRRKYSSPAPCTFQPDSAAGEGIRFHQAAGLETLGSFL